MLETLDCPNCAGPLTLPAGGGESMQCPYCHTTVLLSGRSRGVSSAGGGASSERATPAVAEPKVGLRLLALFLLLIAVLVGIISAIGDRSKPTGILSPLKPGKPAFASMTLEFGSKGITPGHFKSASRISLDHQGRMYVGEGDHGRVQVFDTTGKYLSEFSVGGFDDLVADRNGTVYVASGGKICRFNGATGVQLPDMERRTDDQFGRQSPGYYRCVCITAGLIHAITGYAIGTPGLVTLNITTGRIESVVHATSPPGRQLNLHAILALTTGEIYGLDTEIGAVFKFSPEGTYINQFGGASDDASSGDAPPSQLNGPSCMASDSQGRIYVGNSSGIKVYDKAGNYIDGFGGNEYPNGIAIDEQDNIYACYYNCVREYALQKH